MSLPVPYYQDGSVTLYHGDCREILPLLPHVGLAFADPPYGVDKAAWDLAFSDEWLPLAADRADVLAVTPGISNLLSLPRVVGALTYRWALSVRIVNSLTRGAIGFGNWVPCLVYARDGVSIYQTAQDATQIAIRGDMPPHPSPKPIDAMRWLLSRLPGDLVVDPFAGSGTTLLAAKERGRRAIGIEIEERYCEVAARRLSQEVLPLAPPEPMRAPTQGALDLPGAA